MTTVSAVARFTPSPTRACGEDEAKVLRVWGVEVINGLLAPLVRDVAVQALERIATHHQVHGKHVQHHHHLREDEHAAATLAQPLQQLVK